MRRCVLLACLTLLWTLPCAATTMEAQLNALAAAHQFELKGGNRVADFPPVEADGELLQQLRTILKEINYILVQPPGGAIERLLILGRKGPPPPMPEAEGSEGQVTIPTQRTGKHHTVTAQVTGLNGNRATVQLLVDTGASSLVLPRSMGLDLGFTDFTLHEGEVQTANGKVKAVMGILPELQLESEKITNVKLAFIADEQLGGTALLGMSVLSRYTLVLDDANSQLLLKPLTAPKAESKQ